MPEIIKPFVIHFLYEEFLPRNGDWHLRMFLGIPERSSSNLARERWETGTLSQLSGSGSKSLPYSYFTNLDQAILHILSLH